MQERKKAFWFLIILSTLVIIPFLGETIFYSKGEPREAIVAYTMLESGNWVLPLNYGTDMPYKPPFLYWCIAVFSALLGGVTEFSSRLPSAVFFLAMLGVFFRFFAERKGTKTAFLASVLLLSSFEVHRAAVACRVDMVQVSLIVVSLLLLYRWDEKKCHSVPWLAIVLMACGTLTKGPVGSIFPCMVIGAYQLMRGRSFWKTFLSLAGIGALSLVPWGIWMWAAYQQGGAEFSALMAEENTGRFLGKMSYASHENPLWYNFLTLIWGWVPWTLVLLLSLFGLKWKEMRCLPEGETIGVRLKRAWTKFRNQPPLQLFTWLAILLIFIFYCVPKSKRSVYLLPIYPFMAVLMAEYLLALVQRGAKLFKVSAVIFASLAILLTVAFFTVRLGLIPESLFGTGRHAAENVAFMQALQTVSLPLSKWCLVLLPLVAAVCIGVGVARRAGSYSLLYSIAGCILCIFVSLDSVYQPTVLAVKSDKNLVRQIREVVPQGTVYSYDDMSFYGANFYMGDQMRHFEKELPSEGFVVSSEKVNKRLLGQFDSVYEFDEVFLTERRSCDLRAKIYMYKFRKK